MSHSACTANQKQPLVSGTYSESTENSEQVLDNRKTSQVKSSTYDKEPEVFLTVMTSCDQTGAYHRFARSYCFHFHDTSKLPGRERTSAFGTANWLSTEWSGFPIPARATDLFSTSNCPDRLWSLPSLQLVPGFLHVGEADGTWIWPLTFIQWRTQEFFSGEGGAQQIQLRTEDREDGDLGVVVL